MSGEEFVGLGYLGKVPHFFQVVGQVYALPSVVAERPRQFAQHQLVIERHRQCRRCVVANPSALTDSLLWRQWQRASRTA